MTSNDAPDPVGFAGPWCTLCGYAATDQQPTLSPGRVIGYCRRGEDRPALRERSEARRGVPQIPRDRYGKPTGCGRVIASYDLAEAEYAYRTRRRRLTEARHGKHDPANPGKWANWCAKCDAIQAAKSHQGTNAAGTVPAGVHRNRKDG